MIRDSLRRHLPVLVAAKKEHVDGTLSSLVAVPVESGPVRRFVRVGDDGHHTRNQGSLIKRFLLVRRPAFQLTLARDRGSTQIVMLRKHDRDGTSLRGVAATATLVV